MIVSSLISNICILITEIIGARGAKRKHWLKEEDDAIVSLVKEYGIKQWTTISKQMKQKYGIK